MDRHDFKKTDEKVREKHFMVDFDGKCTMERERVDDLSQVEFKVDRKISTELLW